MMVILVAVVIILAIATGFSIWFILSGEGRCATITSASTTSGNESLITMILSSPARTGESLKPPAGEVMIEGDIAIETDEMVPFSPQTNVHYKTYTVEKYILRFMPKIIGEIGGLKQFRGSGKLELIEYSVKAENVFEFEIECCEPCYARFSYEGSIGGKIYDVVVFGNMTHSGELVNIKIQLAECPTA